MKKFYRQTKWSFGVSFRERTGSIESRAKLVDWIFGLTDE